MKTLFYCDIPYKDKADYKTYFDHEKFYIWCKTMKDNGHVVIVSEYNMPEPFEMIWSKEIKNNLNKKTVIEKLYRICKI